MERHMKIGAGRENEPITLMLLGSGVRFPAYIGGLLAIEEKGLKIDKIVGVSAGSIIGSIYAMGKSPLEMKKLTMEIDIKIFQDFSLMSLIRRKGFYRGKRLEDWMDGMLNGRRFGDDFRIPIFIVATDILNNTPFIFSRFNFPDLKVSKAIRYSAGIPWVFAYEVFVHNGRKRIFVDGNLMVNAIEDMFAKQGRTLILRVISKSSQAAAAEELSLKRYVQKLLSIMMHAVENERVSADRWNDTFIIYCSDIPATKFSITADDKKYLFEQGYEQVRKYLEYKWGI